ncbi:MAG: winged helix-turn-helix transcriptional regulator [Lachnospiraceae bacterium]|nr:winged helix-turn-helix transcriptional regulator [Lachnospiraceae bacterium]
MDNMNEALLEAWLRVSTSINNSRLVSELSYNESLICNLLYKNMMAHSGQFLTATDLCAETKMQKSLMNRTLKQLEARGMITRSRSEQDKRRIYIYLNMEQIKQYELQHEKILDLINAIIGELGEENTLTAIDTLNTIAQVANKLFY